MGKIVEKGGERAISAVVVRLEHQDMLIISNKQIIRWILDLTIRRKSYMVLKIRKFQE